MSIENGYIAKIAELEGKVAALKEENEDWVKMYRAERWKTEELKTLLKAAREDVGRIDWIESKMKMDNDYCEIYFAGLRDFSGQASAYQVESNPQIFTTTTGQTLREAIDKAGKINVAEIRHDHWIP